MFSSITYNIIRIYRGNIIMNLNGEKAGEGSICRRCHVFVIANCKIVRLRSKNGRPSRFQAGEVGSKRSSPSVFPRAELEGVDLNKIRSKMSK